MDAVTGRFDADAHAQRMRTQGYTVIEDFLDAPTLARFRAGLAPFMGSHHGRNDFEGFKTERIYTLVARGKVFEEIAADARLMALIGRFLQPNFLLSASHAISLEPGETPQSIHSDDNFYRQPRPRAPIGISVIGAIDAFTQANGATEVIPGSHLWGEPGGDGRPTDPTELEQMLVPMEIPAGAALVFPGTLLHRGGANVTDKPRLAFTHQYCEPWARPQENFWLSVPREMVREMSPTAQRLLGYEIAPPFLGMVSASHPAKALEPGWVPPVVAQSPS
ncbi:phytanoyl-CoA dioxygenase family protein [Phenylobacterium sp.]|uniref:phytanoyl-CoA dioxygenase family protein n=1 Tax=Phenylobacterium sp. TaxID=1871053 RepID=UPI002DF6BDE9|nr:phytanoyl-CoA dioxygenase family protein [Phenylobacterium sp.]